MVLRAVARSQSATIAVIRAETITPRNAAMQRKITGR